ncbi:sigma-70 family RNA polymerase sigma factor [Calothrix sp. UHCC 0171]|uniref:sigma-70 family RNA polymerase sigma factor n=1 Tax=Calothrix sp. UHCC 0171 TaxID=3110245 RepID=UPI002B1F28D5|nr:sigma-70 family RNA polymerase sigma factor [Calothrix sp. UHCC 0171]MEA5572173.1 sigma-70 family RNA polymerase sigma factor [Calothrix sp. UHCC 0171]
MTPAESATAQSLEQQFTELNDNNKLIVLRHFYRLRLRQYRLLGKYEPDDILNEAISRLDKAVKLGKIIYNVLPWLRQTGLNIINEWSREHHKYRLIDSPKLDLESILSSEENHYEHDDCELYMQLYQALQLLDIDDRRLVILRFYKQLSWQDIVKRLAEKNIHLSETTLRKRGSRALATLRKIFQEQILRY